MMDCDGCCGYPGFPPLAGEMSEGQRGREGFASLPLDIQVLNYDGL